jgi:molybdopterin-guanine dinucleotide biosynthesis protein
MIAEAQKHAIPRIDVGSEIGSGILITPTLILTSFHVVAWLDEATPRLNNNADSIRVRFPTDPITERVAELTDHWDSKADWAVLRLVEAVDIQPLVLRAWAGEKQWLGFGYPDSAKGASELGELALGLGHIDLAEPSGQQAMQLASSKPFLRPEGLSGSPCLVLEGFVVGVVKRRLPDAKTVAPGAVLYATPVGPIIDALGSADVVLPVAPLPSLTGREDTRAELIDTWWKASASLVQWPRRLGKGEGREIERPEYTDLLKRVSQPKPPLVCLLGRPGTGKSALMARLCDDLHAQGWAVLGVKSDLLKEDVDAPEALASSLGLSDLAESAATLEPGTRALVVFDQVDALASLLDQRTERLDAILATLHRLRHLERVAIVLSSREVDYSHEPRLTVLEGEALHLQPLAEKEVRASLAADGIDVSPWAAGDPRFGLLGTPLYLRIFTDIYGQKGEQPPAQMREFDLLRTLWSRWVQPHADRVALMKALAREVGEREVLWVRAAPYEDRPALKPLLSAGVLRQEGERLGFMHQHLFEYVWARERPAGTLAEYILKRSGLMIRPRLWVGLQYERAADEPAYLTTLAALLDRDFDHLSQVALAFVAQVEGWLDQELAWIGRYLDRFPHVVLGSMSASPATFQRIQPRLRGLLAQGNPSAWEYLGRCAARSPKEAVELAAVWPKWLGGWGDVLRGLQAWVPEASRLAEALTDSASDDFGLVHVLEDVGRLSLPDAARLVRRKLEAMWSEAAKNDEEAGRAGEVPRYRESKRVQVFAAARWHDLSKHAQQAPEEFGRQLWDFFEGHVGELVNDWAYPGSYPRDGISWSVGSGLTDVLAKTLRKWAKADSASYLAHLQEHADRPTTAIHRLQALLASALAEVADRHPQVVAEFLLADDRRLQLGLESDLLKWSALLIEGAAVADAAVARRLMEKLLEWMPPGSEGPIEPSARDIEYFGGFEKACSFLRKHFLKRRNQTRYQLLRVLPAWLRDSDPRLKPRFRELDRRFATAENLFHIGEIRSIEHPAPRLIPEGMVAAGVRRVRQHLDREARRTHRFDGPDFCPVLKAAAGLDADFGHAMLQELSVDETDLIGAVLDGLSPEALEVAVVSLDAAGKATAGIQYRCVHALYAVAENQGLSDEVVDLLERWLLAGEVEPEPVVEDEPGTVDVPEGSQDTHDDRRPDPVLLPGGVWFSSGGPSQLAWVAFRGMTRRGPSAQPLLSSKLLAWIDHPVVGWSCWARLLTFREPVGWIVREHRADAAHRLRQRFSRPLGTVNGARAIFKNYRWLPEPERSAWIQLLAISSNRVTRQALGELIGLLGEDNQPEHWRRILNEAGADQERVGLAFVCLNRWKDAPDRLAVTRTLLRILELDGPKARWMVDDFFSRFHDAVSGAPETAELVQMVVARPELTPKRGVDARALERLVAEMPNEVAILVERQLGSPDVWIYRDAVARAVYALHRRAATRERGLALFNQLVNMPQLQSLVQAIDNSRSDFPTA